METLLSITHTGNTIIQTIPERNGDIEDIEPPHRIDQCVLDVAGESTFTTVRPLVRAVAPSAIDSLGEQGAVNTST